MNIEDVRAFVAAVETGSIGKAALRLNLTQPAVTRRVQRLEETLGVTLLDRDSKPARPTRAGSAAYQRCVVILRATDELARETQTTSSAGPLRVGLSPAISESVFAPAIDAVRKAFPDLAMRVTAERSTQLHKQVSDSQLDAAVVASKPGRGFDNQRAVLLGTERVLIVAPRDLRVGKRVKLADLAAQEWVINPDGCGFRGQLDRALAASGTVLNVIAETWGTSMQLALIARGIGLGLIPERLLAESPHRDKVQVITVDNFAPALDVWLVTSGPLGALEAPVAIVSDVVREVLSSCIEDRRQPRKSASAK
jgi:DNA-binding transcriptional LysR family regulator